MSVWAGLTGQGSAVDTLQSAVSGGGHDGSAMAQSWLITGPPGSGRSNAARAFAAALQCDQGGCGDCQSCRTALAGSHPDITVVATQKVTISIDEVRELVSTAQRSPSLGRWRVIIVEDADRMVERTSNVLLKSIEEPSARTVWLLCAPNPHDVIVTIRSRCRQLRLKVPSVDDVVDLLTTRDGIDPTLAREVALAAQCHIGVARRLALNPDVRERREQLLDIGSGIRGVGDAVVAAARFIEVATTEAKASSDDIEAQEKTELYRMLGIEDGKTVPPALRAQVRQLEEEHKRRATRAQRDVIDRALVDLLSLFRDVLVLQLGSQADIFNISRRPRIAELAETSTPEQTLTKLDAIATARRRIAANGAPLLAIEAMAVALREGSGAGQSAHRR